MITELVDRLNEHADFLKEIGFEPNGMVMSDYNEVIETIRLLSEKLHDSQMERSSQFYHGGWISVSERLPNFNDIVLASTYSNYDELRVIVTVYMAEEFWFNGKIIAWMPLPEPYQPKEGE